MSDSRILILKHLLPLVPFDGWSDYAFVQATKAARLKPEEAKHAFANGPVDCIDFFFCAEDDAMAAACPSEELAKMRMPDRIEALILARFKHMAPHREAVRRAMAMHAMPWNSFHAAQSLYRTLDRIWRLAGDTATDFNFYTKRATLAAVFGSTTLYWLNDDSENAENTAQFLKRRLAGVAAFGKWKKQMQDKFSRKS